MCYLKAVVNVKVLSVVRKLSFKFWERGSIHTQENVDGETDFIAVGLVAWSFTGN